MHPSRVVRFLQCQNPKPCTSVSVPPVTLSKPVRQKRRCSPPSIVRSAHSNSNESYSYTRNSYRRFSSSPACSTSSARTPEQTASRTATSPTRKHVFVALGSNVGDRIFNIEEACRHMSASPDIDILDTSPLYETEPMYVEDQDRFLNGVCKIETDLGPMQLLDRLQSIEQRLGRVKIIDKGPRNIDLDIIAYADSIVDTDRLTLPHRLMLEREFVLRPLCDTGGADYVHPQAGQTMAFYLSKLPPSPQPMYPLTPLGPDCAPLRSLDPKRQTKVMSILNVTPDSFSDGGVNDTSNVELLKATVAAQIAEGVDIVDVGGQSSRPSAQDISAEEEIARVLPAIEAIKSLGSKDISISIDTYRAVVAEAAVKAGAHIVNDISAGTLDAEMLATVARLGCTYIMMHMRGTPATMQTGENTSYPDGVVPAIAAELQARLAAAKRAGIKAWRIILDPGVGFAKTTEQNLEILRKMSHLRNFQGLRNYPWLVGSSRKSFIGKVTGVQNAKDRIGGTAATVTAAVHGGAEIVRVHDIADMVQVVKVADGMYRHV